MPLPGRLLSSGRCCVCETFSNIFVVVIWVFFPSLVLGTKRYWEPSIIQTLSRDSTFLIQDILPQHKPKDSMWWEGLGGPRISVPGTWDLTQRAGVLSREPMGQRKHRLSNTTSLVWPCPESTKPESNPLCFSLRGIKASWSSPDWGQRVCDVNLESLQSRGQRYFRGRLLCRGACWGGAQSPMEGAAPVQGGALSTNKATVIMLQNIPTMVKSPFPYKI